MLSTDKITQFRSRTQFICRFTKVGYGLSWCFDTRNFDTHVARAEMHLVYRGPGGCLTFVYILQTVSASSLYLQSDQ
jgi:hypothetical protein